MEHDQKRGNRYTPFNPENTERRANEESFAAIIASSSSSLSFGNRGIDDGTRNQRGARNADLDGIVQQMNVGSKRRRGVKRGSKGGNEKVSNTRGVSACSREISPSEERDDYSDRSSKTNRYD